MNLDPYTYLTTSIKNKVQLIELIFITIASLFFDKECNDRTLLLGISKIVMKYPPIHKQLWSYCFALQWVLGWNCARKNVKVSRHFQATSKDMVITQPFKLVMLESHNRWWWLWNCYIVVLTFEKNPPITIKFMNEKLGDLGLLCPWMAFIRLVGLNNHQITCSILLTM
jgi:hypothetical protein